MSQPSEPTTDTDRWAAVCPTCRLELSNTGYERGYCNVHGLVFIDFGHPLIEPEEEPHDPS